MNSSMTYYQKARRAISIIEVLIAIGVASVGLLAVTLLIPVAAHQAQQGLLRDRSSAVGRAAFREFKIRGMSNPDNWRRFNSTTNVWEVPPVTSGTGNRRHSRGFVLDPTFVAQHGASTFPYNYPNAATADPAVLTMERITLADAFNPPSGVMHALQAEAVFVSHDDLIFERPDSDETLAARQLSSTGGGWQPSTNGGLMFDDDDDDGAVNEDPFDGVDNDGDGRTDEDDIITRRSADARYSWMATIVPKEWRRRDDDNDGTFDEDPINGVDDDGDGSVDEDPPETEVSDLYRLSIVVYQSRDITTIDRVNERVAVIPHDGGYTAFYGGGIGGGDVALFAMDINAGRDAADLEVQPNDWVFLYRRTSGVFDPPAAQPFAVDPPYGESTPRVGRWYRVITAEENNGTSNEISGAPTGIPIRNVLLEGSDWTPDPRYQTQVVIVSNVVGVYEKTLRLENFSMWTTP